MMKLHGFITAFLALLLCAPGEAIVFTTSNKGDAAALKAAGLLASASLNLKVVASEATFRLAFAGWQSVGKTQAVCAFAGRRLGPSVSGTGTRSPIYYQLQHTEDASSESCAITATWKSPATATIPCSDVFKHVDDLTAELRKADKFSNDPIVVRLTLTTAADITVIDLPGLRPGSGTKIEKENVQIAQMWRRVLNEKPTIPLIFAGGGGTTDYSYLESDLTRVRTEIGPTSHKPLVVITRLDQMIQTVEPNFLIIKQKVGSIFGIDETRIAFVALLPELFDRTKTLNDVESKTSHQWDTFYETIGEIDETMRAKHLNNDKFEWLKQEDNVGINKASALIRDMVIEDLKAKLPHHITAVGKGLEQNLKDAELLTSEMDTEVIRSQMIDYAHLLSSLLGTYIRGDTHMFREAYAGVGKRQGLGPLSMTLSELLPTDLRRTFNEEVQKFNFEGTSLMKRFRSVEKEAAKDVLKGEMSYKQSGNAAVRRLSRVFIAAVTANTLRANATIDDLKQDAGNGDNDGITGNVLEQVIGKEIQESSEPIKDYVMDFVRWCREIYVDHVEQAIEYLDDKVPLLQAVPQIRKDLESVLRDIYIRFVEEKVTVLGNDVLNLVDTHFKGLDTAEMLNVIRLLACSNVPVSLLHESEQPTLPSNGGGNATKTQHVISIFKQVAEGGKTITVDDLVATEGLKFVTLSDANLPDKVDELNQLIHAFVAFHHGTLAFEVKRYAKVLLTDELLQLTPTLFDRFQKGALEKETFSDEVISFTFRNPIDAHRKRVQELRNNIESLSTLHQQLDEVAVDLNGGRRRSSAGQVLHQRVDIALNSLDSELSKCQAPGAGTSSAPSSTATGAPSSASNTLFQAYQQHQMHDNSTDASELKKQLRALRNTNYALRRELDDLRQLLNECNGDNRGMINDVDRLKQEMAAKDASHKEELKKKDDEIARLKAPPATA